MVPSIPREARLRAKLLEQARAETRKRLDEPRVFVEFTNCRTGQGIRLGPFRCIRITAGYVWGDDGRPLAFQMGDHWQVASDGRIWTDVGIQPGR